MLAIPIFSFLTFEEFLIYLSHLLFSFIRESNDRQHPEYNVYILFLTHFPHHDVNCVVHRLCTKKKLICIACFVWHQASGCSLLFYKNYNAHLLVDMLVYQALKFLLVSSLLLVFHDFLR